MYIDLLFLSLILLFGLLGFINGFVKQLLSILMWLSIFLFAHPLGQWLKHQSGWNWFSQAPDMVAWGIAAFFVGLLFLCIAGIVHWARKNPPLRPLDRWMGLGLGSLKGFIFSLFICLGFQLIPAHLRERFDQFDRDSEKSTFVKMAEPMMGWNAVSTLKSLNTIQSKLAEKLEKKTEFPGEFPGGAWSLESREDRN